MRWGFEPPFLNQFLTQQGKAGYQMEELPSKFEYLCAAVMDIAPDRSVFLCGG